MAWYFDDDRQNRRTPPEVDEIIEDNGDHGLLQERTYNFSLLTRQRALIAWIGTGRKNQYLAVCRYYHFLEEYENTLTPEARERSRTLEFKNLPLLPQADLLQQVIPTLISQPPPTYVEPSTSRYTSSETILPASIIITNYLQEYQTDMGTFLKEFKEYSDREGLSSSLNHLIHFINLKTGKAKREPESAINKPAETINPYEELNNSFNNLYFGPNAMMNMTKPPPTTTTPGTSKQKNNKHLKPTNKLNIPTSPGGPSPSDTYVNGGSPKMNGGKPAKAKVNGEDKENINSDTKKNYAEVAKKHNGNKLNLSNASQ